MKRSQLPITSGAISILLFLPLVLTKTNAGPVYPTESAATRVLGQPDLTTNGNGDAANQFYFPLDVEVDPATGKVFVADGGNNRVLRFASIDDIADGADAEAVLGQSDFGLSAAATTASGMSEPSGLKIGPSGELWIAENGNNRVLRFDNAATISSGASADAVLGQPDFTSSAGGDGAGEMNGPRDVAVDDDGNLFVTEIRNSRVLIFLNAAAKADGEDADQVLGQTDFDESSTGTDADSLKNPQGADLSEDGTLYVADSGNNRIMIFSDVITSGNGPDADAVLGQEDFETGDEGLSAFEFDYPNKLCVKNDGTLLVADKDNRRILVFYDVAGQSGEVAANAVIGQEDFESEDRYSGATATSLPLGVCVDSDERIYVADFDRQRVAVFESESTRPDLTVGATSSERKGNDVYNSSGSGQRKSIRITRRKKVKFHCSVGNDGSIDENFLISGKGSNSRFRVKHYLITGGKTNVTGAVKRGTHETSEIASTEMLRYRMEVKPKSRMKNRRGNFNTWLRGISLIDGELDKVRGRVKKR